MAEERLNRFVTYDKGTKIEALEDLGEESRSALDAIGALVVAKTQTAFKKQKRGRFNWPPRSVPSIHSILADLNAGRNARTRALDPRPALVSTSRLKKSIAHRVLSNTTVEIGTVVPYALIHQEGGTSSTPITDRARKGIAKLIKRAPWKEHADALAPFIATKKKEHVSMIPKRTFLLVTPKDRKEMGAVMAAVIVTAGTLTPTQRERIRVRTAGF